MKTKSIATRSSDNARQALQVAGEFVRERPVVSAGIALAIGAAVVYAVVRR
jgi:ElaB/YqjD/DUF883 family membrane-anchored ribosome-binding protein